MINPEIEKIIMGAWLCGEHTEDIKKLKKDDFPVLNNLYDSIKKNIKNGMNEEELAEGIVRISKETGNSLAELMQMRSEYITVGQNIYNQTIEELKEFNLRAYIASIDPVKCNITEIEETIKSYKENKGSSLPTPAGDWLTELINDIDERAKRPIVKVGIPHLDDLMCGIRKKELTTVGARPSVGKSAFTLQVALNIVKQGYKVLYFPLEMSTLQTAERIMVSNLPTPIPNDKLKKGNISKEEWMNISFAMDEMYKIIKSENFLIFEGINNIKTIEMLVKKHKPFLIVVDQLEQLNSTIRFKDKRERFSHMTNSLKRLAMSENIAVLLAAQLNRNAQKTEPTMAELKESGSIEEDSDNVLLLHRYEPEDMANPDEWDNTRRPIQLRLEKNRSGETGNTMSVYIANKFKFYELEA